MKILLMTMFAVVVTLVGGCQSVKESAHRNIDEWVDLAGVEVYWDHIPENRRRTGLTGFVLGENKDGYNSYGGCVPSPWMSYPRSTLNLLDAIPAERIVVTESGIHHRDDVARMQTAGVHAFLIGEALMRAPRPGAKLQELFGR